MEVDPGSGFAGGDSAFIRDLSATARILPTCKLLGSLRRFVVIEIDVLEIHRGLSTA
jgi:hypothetical protein